VKKTAANRFKGTKMDVARSALVLTLNVKHVQHLCELDYRHFSDPPIEGPRRWNN
jgi:hypothetical protein